MSATVVAMQNSRGSARCIVYSKMRKRGIWKAALQTKSPTCRRLSIGSTRRVWVAVVVRIVTATRKPQPVVTCGSRSTLEGKKEFGSHPYARSVTTAKTSGACGMRRATTLSYARVQCYAERNTRLIWRALNGDLRLAATTTAKTVFSRMTTRRTTGTSGFARCVISTFPSAPQVITRNDTTAIELLLHLIRCTS